MVHKVKHGVFIENPKCEICNTNISHEWLDGDYTVLICDKKECWDEFNKKSLNMEQTLKDKIIDAIISENHGHQSFDKHEAANEIEKLILEEIGKAFEAGEAREKWIHWQDPTDIKPNKEQYINNLKK